MNYKVIINPELGGKDVGKSYNGQSSKEYNLQFSKLLSEQLNDIGISNVLVRTIDKDMTDMERINFINQISSPDSIILTNGLGDENGIEIIYSLKNNDSLASRLANNLDENNFKVNKYYQRRNSSNTSKDYDSIIGDVNGQSIIIRYGNIKDNSDYLNNRINDLVMVIANTLKSYLGLADDYYIVKKGDNLYSIARKFNTTVDNIKKLNNLTSNNLSIGQRLIIKNIPLTNNDNTDYYVVKPGDTLYGIAKKYNLTVENLKKMNNLTSNILTIGSRLKIKENSANVIKYTVVNGDTLYGIARKYNVTVDNLKKTNNLANNTLSIGQVLIIPKDNVMQYIVKPGDRIFMGNNDRYKNIINM